MKDKVFEPCPFSGELAKCSVPKDTVQKSLLVPLLCADICFFFFSWLSWWKSLLG